MKLKGILLSGALLCSCSFRVQALTLSEAETEVRRIIKDTPTSASLQRYSDTVIDAFINQAQREVVSATWCLQTSSAIALYPGSNGNRYILPSDLIAVKSVRLVDVSSRTRNIPETSYKAMLENNPDFERQTGPPMQYFTRYSRTGDTHLTIGVYPTPTSSSTGTLTVDYYKQPIDVSNDSDVLLDGYAILLPYHQAVVYQVAYKIKLIEGDSAQASVFAQLYQAAIQTMIIRLGERPNFNPGISAASPASSTR